MKASDSKLLVRALLFLFLFVFFSVCVALVGRAPIGPENTEVGFSGLNGAFFSLTGFSETLYKITSAALKVCIAFTALAGAAMLVRALAQKRIPERRFFAFVALVAVAFLLKEVFDRFLILNRRPVLIGDDVFPEASYPSSTTLLTCVLSGALCILAKDEIKNARLCSVLRIALIVFAVLVVIGRTLCGAHWLTDIIGGLLLSGVLLSFFRAAASKPEA